jgi:hypothetical protein
MSVVKPSHNISIVNVGRNEVIHEGLLKKLTDDFRSGVGLVVRTENKIDIEKFTKNDLGDKDKFFELMTKVQNGTKKYDATFIFHAFPEEYDEDELQPYVAVKDSKNNPILVCSLEGSFLTDVSDEGFGEAHVLWTSYLEPHITEMYGLMGNDVSKLVAYLKGKAFENNLKNVTGHRGVFSFMPIAGEPFTVGDAKDLGGKFGFGTASQACGWTESAINAATRDPAPAAIEAAKTSKYADEEPTTAPKKEASPPSVPIVPQEPKPNATPLANPSPTPESKVAAQFAEEIVPMTPPAGLGGKKLKQWYRDRDPTGQKTLPTDWMNKPPIMVKVKKSVQALADIDTLNPRTVPKDMKSENPPRVTLPTITGEQQRNANEFIKKHLGDGSALIDNPLEHQKVEQNLAKFSELILKGDLDTFEKWPTGAILAFAKQNPEVAALGLIELRSDRVKRKMAMAALTKDGNKVLGELVGTEPTVTQTKPGGTTSKPVEVAPTSQSEELISKYA